MKFRTINNETFNIETSLKMIEEVFNMSLEDLLNDLVISEADYKLIQEEGLDSDNIPREIFEKIYNYAYNNKLYINDILWLEYQEQISNDEILLSHGSRKNIVGDIRLDMSGDSNDFSNGFYCGQSLKQAGMFVSQEPESSLYILSYNEQPINLIEMRFNVSTNWMLAVAYYRDTLGEYKNADMVKEIIHDVDGSDLIIAPIADNRMFQIIDAFTDGQITDLQCQYALASTNLGYQYVFKTQNAVDHLTILDHLYLCDFEKNKYNDKSQEESNTSLMKANYSKKKFAGRGKYIDELLK